jgi:spore coat polysaccharide biosynthesis protein SpsF
MNPSIGIVLQARMGSIRMPGKVLQPFYDEKSILEVIIQRLVATSSGYPIVLATSTDPQDDLIESMAKQLGVLLFRGSEKDVLQRFIDCASTFQFSHLVRICSDNPCLDFHLMNDLIHSSIKEDIDYSSHQLSGNLPAIRSHWGIFTEYVAVTALEKASRLTEDPFYHEHVTNFIYDHSSDFRIKWLNAPEEIYQTVDIRLTIDTPEDFATMQQLYGFLVESGKPITFNNVLQALNALPQLKQRMRAQIERFQK